MSHQSEHVPTVTVVTVGTNERAWLVRCFSSLLTGGHAGHRLVVRYIDNASGDGSTDLVARLFPDVKITFNRTNLGFSAANNIGMRLALDEDGADYVFLVNPDTQTPATLVRELTRFMQSRADYGIVGPLQYRYSSAPHNGSCTLDSLNEWSEVALRSGERHAFAADWPDHPSPAGPEDGRAPGTLEHAYVQGSALFVRAATLRAVGMFDEVFHTYYEEVDLCRRARWAGWRVALLLDLGIQHQGGGGAGTGRYRRVQMRRNRYYYLFTDIDWKLGNTMRLAGRWLRKDLCGHGVGGRTTRGRAILETAVAAMWLIGRVPQIIDRR